VPLACRQVALWTGLASPRSLEGDYRAIPAYRLSVRPRSLQPTDEIGVPRDLACRLLRGQGDRWDHTQKVASRANSVAIAIPERYRQLLVDSAWLHDIGYSLHLARTGFHALDGARYLIAIEAPLDLVGAVAHHSCALYEAEERGLTAELETFRAPPQVVMDALAYADMTTGPTGRDVSVEDRLTEILNRYDSDNPVHRAITNARIDLVNAVRRTEVLLQAVESSHPI